MKLSIQQCGFTFDKNAVNVSSCDEGQQNFLTNLSVSRVS